MFSEIQKWLMKEMDKAESIILTLTQVWNAGDDSYQFMKDGQLAYDKLIDSFRELTSTFSGPIKGNDEKYGAKML